MDIRHEKIVSAYRVRIKENWQRSVPHWHQRIEVALVRKSCFSVTIQGRHYTARPGDLLVIRSGEIHHLQAMEPEAAMGLCIFSPTLLYQTGIPFIRNYIRAEELEQAGIRETVNDLFFQLLEEYDQNRKYAELLIQARIQLLYGLLARHFEEAPSGFKTLDKFREFQQILSYISENYNQNLDLAWIAKKLNYNPSYVSAMFVTYTGVNYKAYLDSIRISHASKLLLDTNHSVSHISALCGYENIRTFNNVFRRITGMTPSQFRKKT